MRKAIHKTIWLLLAAGALVSPRLVAVDAGFRGVVTDEAGKPVRGAIVKATAGYKGVIRYSQADGRYALTLPPGKYSVNVEAFGFASKIIDKDASTSGDTNFTLTRRLDLARVSGADLENLIPHEEEAKRFVHTCIECHGIEYIMRRRGFTAEQWRDFIPKMTNGKVVPPNPNAAELTGIVASLEKYFGPKAPYFAPGADLPKPEQLKHADLPDEALNATIREYTIPTGLAAMPHSIMVDAQDNAWFSERGIGVHKIGRFDAATEEFKEYTVPEKGTPHTGVVGNDGMVWMSLIHDGNPFGQPDLAKVDPQTGKVSVFHIPDSIKYLGVHTLAKDREGNIWMSGSTIWKFDVKAEQFKEYKVPVPSSFPPTSIVKWGEMPGEPPRPVNVSRTLFYDIRVDSKGIVWASEYNFGYLVKLDPATGKSTEFHPPDTNMIKGVEIDAQDNVWFAGFHSNVLGKLDQKTGRFNIYRFPTAYAMPYGLSINRKTGDVWVGDMNGAHVTRFDPKTERFTEFPIPFSRPKFLGIDSKDRIWFTEYLDGRIGVLDPGWSSQAPTARR